MMRRKRLVWCVLALSLSGCVTAAGGGIGALIGRQSDREAGRGEPSVGTAVAVRFAAPRSVAVLSKGTGDTVRVVQARVVLGRIVSASGDALTVELAEISGPADREKFSGQQQATIALDSAADVQVLNRHPGRTAGLVVGMALGFIGDVFLFLYLAHGS